MRNSFMLEKWMRKSDATLADVEQGFLHPSKEYAPYAFWFWIDKEAEDVEYGRQAKEMAAKGLSCGYPQDRGFHDHDGKHYFDGNTVCTNGRYFACFDAALEETRKAGMTMGYCEPACIFTMSEMRADHPELQAVSLKCERIDVESGECIDVPEAFFSVAAELGEEGKLDSDSLRLLSAGEQVISDTGKSRVYVFTTYTARSNEGSCNNYLQHEMADMAMKMIHDPMLERYADDVGDTLSGHFFDLEGDYGYKLCWSKDFEEEYERRCGRSWRLYCPLLLEKDMQGRWMRARYDWFDAVSEVYSQVMFGAVSKRLAEHGLYFTTHLWEEKLLGQALLAGDPMRVYRAVSMPGIDHLKRNPWNVRTYKEAQSVAELEGKRMMCEILGCAGWEATPLDYRRSLNNAFAMSVSNIVPHGVYSDRKQIDKARYAPDFFDWQPAWHWMKQYTDYARRGSFMVSQGRMTANVLLYNPLETAWALLGDGAFDTEPSFEKSWTYDRVGLESCFEYGEEIVRIDQVYIHAMEQMTDANVGFLIGDRHYMEQATVKAGRLCIGDYTFETLVLPPLHILSVAVMQKILEFAKSGGQVMTLGMLPDASAEEGLGDEAMLYLVEELQKYAVDASDGIEAHLHELPRMAVWDEGGFRMHIQQRVIGGHIFYWLCNNDSQPHEGVLRLKGAQGRAVRWDLESGKRIDVVTQEEQGDALLSLHLAAGEGFFLEFDAEQSPITTCREAQMHLVTLPKVWHISVDEKHQMDNPTGYAKNVAEHVQTGFESELADWTQLGLTDFSGIVDYEIAFALPHMTSMLTIDLGEVCHMAEITLDDRHPIQRFWGPYQAEFSNVEAGQHRLHVRVGNLLINQLRPVVQAGEGKWYEWDPQDEEYRSGLFGPVKIFYSDEIK